jgi:RNA polymerase sigma-70 factor, ECF subfamily
VPEDTDTNPSDLTNLVVTNARDPISLHRAKNRGFPPIYPGSAWIPGKPGCKKTGWVSSIRGVRCGVHKMPNFGEVLRAAKKGDQDAFALLWREFQPGLLRYLKVKAAPAAEDLAADTWIRAIRALQRFEGDEPAFRAWLFTMARNRLTDWYRASERRVEFIGATNLAVMPASNNVEAEADESSGTDKAVALIASLPADQGEAVMLRVVAGLHVSHVATIMDKSPGAVRVLCHRGLRRLEQILEQLEYENQEVVSRPAESGHSKVEVTRGVGIRIPSGPSDQERVLNA